MKVVVIRIGDRFVPAACMYYAASNITPQSCDLRHRLIRLHSSVAFRL